MGKIRVGIVGSGYIAHYHARGLQECNSAELYAIANPTVEKGKDFAGKYGLKHVFSSADDLINSKIVDAVIISTPNVFHSEYVLKAFKAGLDAFVEKPMACSVAEAEAMKEQALKEGKVLMVGHMWRFDREVRYLASLVSSEKIGRIFKTTGYGIHTNWGPGGWFTQKKLSGGGALVDMGIHAIDTVRFILGDPHPVKVYARIGTYMKDFDVDDTGVLMITWDNRTTSVIESGWWQPQMDGPEAGTKLYGTKGFACLFPTHVKLSVNERAGIFTPEFPEREEHCDQHMYTLQMKEYIRAIEERDTPFPGAEEGLVNMRILECAYRSSETGEAVSLQ